MNPVSKNLKLFINKYFKKSKNDISKLRFSTSTIKFIKNIYGSIIKCNLECINKANITKVPFHETSFPKSNNFQGIPDEIRHEIENNEQTTKIYEFKVKNRNIRVFFIFPMQGSQLNEKEMMKYIERMFIWLSIAYKYSPVNCAKNLNVYLYLTDLKKMLPTIDASPIDWEHANTAFTYSCREEHITSHNENKDIADISEINIFRKEEWFKVFIHETIHCMGLDFSHMDTGFSNSKINSMFNINIDVKLFESYTECLAEIMNSIFFVYYSVINNKNVENIDYIYEKIEENMKNEILFSLFQCVKVLDHYGLSYKNMYENTNENRELCKKYSEKSPIFAYYVLKPILLFHINDFVDWINKNNKGSLSFKKTVENINNYCMFFENFHKTPEYIDVIQIVENDFRKIKNNTDLRRELETLRMTVFEM
uniref:Uncharacterized protein n=1 Tax=viral metagenome TaxID=1070528 RepID=A0A6C0EST8_9ZZZZ